MQANRIFYGKEKPTNAVAGDCWFRNNELMILKNNWEASVNVNGFVIMMINYFAMQIEFGWITLEDVPKKYRDKVKQLVESGNIGTE
ncbi:TPA: hypothetical protein VKD36_000347 [Streptococcus pyogenes]|nr:hypothetical protein [Streptococcus pyogenes]